MIIQLIALTVSMVGAIFLSIGLHHSVEANSLGDLVSSFSGQGSDGGSLLDDIGTAFSGGEDPKILGDVGCVGGGIIGGFVGGPEGAISGCAKGKEYGSNYQRSQETDHEHCNYGYNSESCDYRTPGPDPAGGTNPPQVVANPPSSTVSFDRFWSDLNPRIIDDPVPSGSLGCQLGLGWDGKTACDSRSGNFPMEGNSKPYSIPSHVQTSGGSKWSKDPGDPSTWSVVQMTDPDHRGQFKVIDEEGKNVAANFVSREEAQDYIDG